MTKQWRTADHVFNEKNHIGLCVCVSMSWKRNVWTMKDVGVKDNEEKNVKNKNKAPERS